MRVLLKASSRLKGKPVSLVLGVSRRGGSGGDGDGDGGSDWITRFAVAPLVGDRR